MVCDSLIFYCFVILLVRGLLGLGVLSKVWIDRRIVFICRVGFYLFEIKIIYINN